MASSLPLAACGHKGGLKTPSQAAADQAKKEREAKKRAESDAREAKKEAERQQEENSGESPDKGL